jgi:hypothetical protein
MPDVKEFDSIESLLEDEKVRWFKTQPDFHKYSHSGHYLMAEYENGKRWWVVGRVEGDISSLPPFTYGE